MKKLVAAVLLLGFGTANAALVSYNGYTLDTDTNVVTGGGLEWMQWDETLGQSVNQALANHGGSAWRIATNTEMAALLNAFSFGITFDGIESTSQGTSAEEGIKATNFIELFGQTQLGASGPRAQAFYGSDLNNNGIVNHLYVQHFASSDGFQVFDYGDTYPHITFTPDKVQFNAGVALVRVVGTPIPAAVWLFGSALGLLGWIRRRA